MAYSVDPDQTAPIDAVCSGSTLFASILNLSVILSNYLQQTTFSDAFFLGALRVKLAIYIHYFHGSDHVGYVSSESCNYHTGTPVQ